MPEATLLRKRPLARNEAPPNFADFLEIRFPLHQTENLNASVDRAERLKEVLRDWNREHSTNITMPELALRFILSHPTVSTIIPGMRKLAHVESNLAASEAGPLPGELFEELRAHRWVRKPAAWSQ